MKFLNRFSKYMCACFAVSLTIGAAAQDAEVISPSSNTFKLNNIPDYEARYTSSFSKTGAFTLHVRTSGDGSKVTMVDIIPGENTVIVSQRMIDLKSQLLEFYAGPYFAWGPEFVVGQTNGEAYDWSRVPVGGGAPQQISGDIANGGYTSEMFSPLLASLMPRSVGQSFQLPAYYARIDDDKRAFLSSEMDEYMVTGREKLETPSGLSCECWVIDKKSWTGALERIWVARSAPYVFKRHRDVGGARSFVSELLSYRSLEQ